MSPDVRRAYDEATVILLRATSSPGALAVADHDERYGLPAYDDSPAVAGRDELRVCPAPGCGRRFWAAVAGSAGGRQLYCDGNCRQRFYYATKPAMRERMRVWARRRQADLRRVEVA